MFEISFRARRPYALIGALLLGTRLAGAQAPPDAGSVLRQIEERQRTLRPPPAPQFVAPPPLESSGGATVTVDTFQFAGNTLLTNEQLGLSVAGFAGRPIDFVALQNAAIAVATAYRNAGWVVRTYLPRQDITSGTVVIQIIEARFGAVELEGDPKRISTERLRAIVETAQPPGELLNAAALDRSLLLINDLPGVTATGRLAAGRNDSETDLLLAVHDSSPAEGDIAVDNAGGRFTGESRVIGSASLNDRLGVGDRATALVLHSQGSNYIRLGYLQPFGNRGWRIGANASHLDYDVITPEFTALDAHGTSTAAGVEASYPLLRSRLKNLYVDVNADNHRFDNKSAGVTTTRYSVQTATVGAHGNLFDSFHGGGATGARLSLVQGRVDLSGSPNEAADAATTQTTGGFLKLNLSVSRLQVITRRVSLFASLERQFANANLDSSEKLYLGGSQGVRAYPESEAGGSEGTLVSLEARARVTTKIGVTGFLDWGSSRINKDNDFIGAAARNGTELKGFGVSVAWTSPFGWNLKAVVARRSGENPNATVAGDDQDGSLVKTRAWLQVAIPF